MAHATRLLFESVVSLAQAARHPPPIRAGRPVHPSTVWRWTKFGVATPAGPIHLETVHLAGRTVTTREAVTRFLVAVAAARGGPTGESEPAGGGPPARAAHAAAKARLDRLNI